MLDSDRLEERLDRELIVRLCGDGFANQRGMRERMSRITTTGSRIKRQLGGARIAAVAAERLPEVKEAASEVAEKVVDTVSRAGETAVTRLRHPTRHPAVIATPEN